MLYPQTNTYRDVIDLGGFWDFRFDPDERGLPDGWSQGLHTADVIAVPASWNEQFAESRDYIRTAWYQKRFTIPKRWDGQCLFLRFDAVNYLAEVWLNGARLGEHEGGFLPFVFDVTAHVRADENVLVVRVNGDMAVDRVPPGNVSGAGWHSMNRTEFPDNNFGFFPYCGIQRPVLLFAQHETAILDITVRTEIEAHRDGQATQPDGLVQVKFAYSGTPTTARISLHDTTAHIVQQIDLTEERVGLPGVTLQVPRAVLWSPENPHLYDLRIELLQGDQVVDAYTLPIGIRTIRVDGTQLLLNGEPVRLVGFGRHEDFPVIGRGLLPALIVKDFALMRWIGANSFRTSHYPYAEQTLMLADRLGFLVIDEMPAIGLFFREDGLERRNTLCKQYLDEMIQRDKNHPSVILWCVANEPHSVNPEKGGAYWRDRRSALTESYSHPAAKALFKELAEQCRQADPTRPVTLVSYVGAGEDSFEYMDVVSINRYDGWYTQAGQIARGVAGVAEELDLIFARFGKPILMSEFGAEALPGHHALPPEMYSEEYQAEFLTQYIRLARQKPYVIGEHVWNLCDFKLSQHVAWPGSMNHKGVFTRERRPKMAAFRLRTLWTGKPEDE